MNKVKRIIFFVERKEFAFRKLLKARIRQFIEILFSRDLSLQRIYNADALNSGYERIAIYALYPKNNSFYEENIIDFVFILKEANYQPLIVSNDMPSETLMKKLIEIGATVMVRKNIGRDFGAYRTGFLHIRKIEKFGSLERLIFVNDTLFWPKESSNIIKETSFHPWQSLYLNLERNVHAHSFYLNFDKTIFRSNKFMEFWRRFLPVDSRNYNIHKGENALSNTLLKMGHYCKPLVDLDFIHKRVNLAVNEETKNKLYAFRIPSLVPQNPPIAGLPNRTLSNLKDYEEFKKQVLMNFGNYIYSDAPHRIGLALHYLCGMPLKADLFKFYSIAEIESLVLPNMRNRVSLINFYVNKSSEFQMSDLHTKKLRRLGEI